MQHASCENRGVSDLDISSRPAPPVASPCISVCRMDPRTQLCEGCARTIDEIANWSRYSDTDKQAVWQRIAARRGRA
jgi:predicted Fe-S protein YdhL (DUF1289 family)